MTLEDCGLDTSQDLERQRISKPILEATMSQAYAKQYERRYRHLTNYDSSKAQAEAERLRNAGFDAITHPVAFDIFGNSTSMDTVAILVRVDANHTLEMVEQELSAPIFKS